MSQLNVDTIKKADGTGNLSVPAETGTVVTTASPSLGRRRITINGDMRIAQRGTSATGVTSSGYTTVDRFNWLSALDDEVTLNQSSESPDGFSNSFHVDVTTADADVSGVSDRAGITYAVEAQDLQHLGYGTASAQAMTLSFWIRSSVTGTYSVGFYQPDSARFYSSTYVVNSADTWEQKTITISGDASGQIDNNNGSGLTMYFWLAASSTYTSGSGDTWSASGSEWAAGHNVNVLGDAANNFYITGVQLEVGSVATPFEHRSYGEELALCQRYYTEFGNHTVFAGRAYGSADLLISAVCPVPLRASPTVGGNGDMSVYGASVNDAVAMSAVGVFQFTANTNKVALDINTYSGLTDNRVANTGITNSGTLTLDAEL